MTWKTGDTVSLPVQCQTAAGVPAVFANQAAFTAAGWSLTWYSGATALASQPSYTLSPIGTTGWHAFTFVLPSGVDHVLINAPSGYIQNPVDYVLPTPNYDTDSIASQIAAAVGATISGSQIQSYDFTIIEGDNPTPQVFTIPAAALQVIDTASKIVYQYTDLSDISGQPWTIACQARGSWNQAPGSSVSFSFDACITDKTNRICAIGFNPTVPAGAVVVNPDGTADTTGSQASTVYKYDIQLQPPSGSTYAGRKLTVVTGNVTILRQQTTTP